MPSSYTTSGVVLMADSEESGTWGQVTNTNLQIINRFASQAGSISLSGTTHTLDISDGVLSDGHYGILVFGGSPSGTNTVTINPSDAQRIYMVKNDSGQSVIMSQGSGSTVTVADGGGAIIYCDGAGAGASVVDVTASFFAAGLNVTGDLDVTGTTTLAGASTTADITFGDNDKAIFGAGSDLQIYHDGTTNKIVGSIDVTGTVTADGLKVDGITTFTDANVRVDLMESDSTDLNGRLQNNGGVLQIRTLNDAKSSAKDRITIDHATGDISFYEDTGTTPKFFWDASAERLGIGTSLPAELLHIKGSTNGDGITLQRDSVTANDYAQLGFLVSTNDAGTPSAWVRGLRGASANQEFLTLGTADTERLRIDSSGNVLVGTTTSPSGSGQIVANGGVYLGGTGSANLLDDYEEGSFTPNVADAASGGNEATYTRNVGYYTKVGRQVTIVIELLNINTTGLTGANDIYITGLPFTSDSVTGDVKWNGSMNYNFITLDATRPYLTPQLLESSTVVRLKEDGDNIVGDFVTVSQLASGTCDINITLTYFT